MKKNTTPIFTFLMFFIMFSCCKWTSKDQEKYLLECQRAKLDSTFCACSLEKITNKYNCFEEAMQNENDFPELFLECNK